MTTCALCDASHPRQPCARATVGVATLLRRGAELAGSQAALATILGISAEGITRAKRRGTLDAAYRAVLVGYLRHPRRPPPPVPRLRGRRPAPASAHPSPWIAAPPRLLARFLRLAAGHPRGFTGAVHEALERFVEQVSAGVLPAAPAPQLELERRRCRVRRALLAAFDRAVGGAPFRPLYLPLAIEGWIAASGRVGSKRCGPSSSRSRGRSHPPSPAQHRGVPAPARSRRPSSSAPPAAR